MNHSVSFSWGVMAACLFAGGATAASVADPLPEPFPDTPEARATADADELEDLYTQGRIAEVARRGLALIRGGGQPDAELRLKIALSLSATRQTPAAIEQLAAVVDTWEMPAAQQARLPLANAYRWSGRADLALPHFEHVLKQEPDNAAARSGLTAVTRELRPRATVQWTGTDDNGGLQVHQGVAKYRWRNEDLNQIYEVETHISQHEFTGVGPRGRTRGATFRYERPDLPLQPQVAVTFDGAPLSGLLADIKLKLSESLSIGVGRDNWGEVALAPRALQAGLTANRVNADGMLDTPWGMFYGRLALNQISDGNRITTGHAKFTPALNLAGGVIKPYVFVDARNVRFNTPDYWSPAEGVGLYGLGTTLEWVHDDWHFILAGQYGQRWYGDAGKSWIGSASAQRWLTDRTSVTANWFGLSSIRDGARYRSKALTLKVDHLF